MKNLAFVIVSALGLLATQSPAYASDVACRITDSTAQKVNEAPAATNRTPSSDSTPSSTGDSQETTKNALKNSGASRSQGVSPPSRCQLREACVHISENEPKKYVLCDAGIAVHLEQYTDNLNVRVVDSATRRDIVRATTPSKDFTELTLVNDKPRVSISCFVYKGPTKDCPENAKRVP